MSTFSITFSTELVFSFWFVRLYRMRIEGQHHGYLVATPWFARFL